MAEFVVLNLQAINPYCLSIEGKVKLCLKLSIATFSLVIAFPGFLPSNFILCNEVHADSILKE